MVTCEYTAFFFPQFWWLIYLLKDCSIAMFFFFFFFFFPRIYCFYQSWYFHSGAFLVSTQNCLEIINFKQFFLTDFINFFYAIHATAGKCKLVFFGSVGFLLMPWQRGSHVFSKISAWLHLWMPPSLQREEVHGCPGFRWELCLQGWCWENAPSSEGVLFFFPLQFFKFYLFVYLFIYGCVGSSFLCEGFL